MKEISINVKVAVKEHTDLYMGRNRVFPAYPAPCVIGNVTHPGHGHRLPGHYSKQTVDPMCKFTQSDPEATF